MEEEGQVQPVDCSKSFCISLQIIIIILTIIEILIDFHETEYKILFFINIILNVGIFILNSYNIYLIILNNSEKDTYFFIGLIAFIICFCNSLTGLITSFLNFTSNDFIKIYRFIL